MNNLHKLICTSTALLILSPALVHADAACDAEIAEIQAVLDAPDSSIDADTLDQANILLAQLSEACSAGTPFAEVKAALADQIRSLLGMGGAE